MLGCSWITLFDGPLPFVDAVYALTLAGTTVAEYGPLVVEALFAKDDKSGERKRANDLQGEPGSTSKTYQKDGNIKQERTYAEDGYPDIDIDHDHEHHGHGSPHMHRWSRPANGGDVTFEHRGGAEPITNLMRMR